MSDANQVQVRYVAEVTEGTTPVDSANWQDLRVVSVSLDAVPAFALSDEIVSDRLRTGQRKINDTISGQIVCRLSEDTLDVLLEALMQGAWTTNVLKAGTTARFFTLEVEYTDITVFQAFKGCQINQADLSFTRDGLVTVTLNFMGMSAVISGTSLVGAGSSAAVTTTEVMAGIDVSTIKIDGTETTLDIAQVSLTVNNNMYAVSDLRVAGAGGHGSGFSDISGAMDAYLADSALRAKLDNQTNFDLDFTVGIGAKTFQFDMPTARLTQAPITVPGGNQAIIQNCQFAAFKDTGTSSNLTITRAT